MHLGQPTNTLNTITRDIDGYLLSCNCSAHVVDVDPQLILPILQLLYPGIFHIHMKGVHSLIQRLYLHLNIHSNIVQDNLSYVRCCKVITRKASKVEWNGQRVISWNPIADSIR
jgi:hypothetical protein